MTQSSFEAPLIPRGTVVLQVAALTRESEAVALVEALRNKDFPAFVLVPSADHYHRVQVGPYDADTESAYRVERRLEKEGFKPIIKRWRLDRWGAREIWNDTTRNGTPHSQAPSM